MDWCIGGRSEDGSSVDIRQPGRGTAVCIGVAVRTAGVVIEEHNREIARLTSENEALRQRIRPLLVIESYAQDVANAWTRLGRCEDEFGPEDGACGEYRDRLDSDIILLKRAVDAGREPDVC